MVKAVRAKAASKKQLNGKKLTNRGVAKKTNTGPTG
jgi:hypothetical protein